MKSIRKCSKTVEPTIFKALSEEKTVCQIREKAYRIFFFKLENIHIFKPKTLLETKVYANEVGVFLFLSRCRIFKVSENRKPAKVTFETNFP